MECGAAAPLRLALVMWTIGARNVDQSLCAVRQYLRVLPPSWSAVAVHDAPVPLWPQLLANVSSGRVRALHASELEARLVRGNATTPAAAAPAARGVPKRRLFYRASEADAVRSKLLTWALVEYDRVLSVDTDVYLRASPFRWLSCEMLAYTADSSRLVGTRACDKRHFNGGFLFFRPDARVAARLLVQAPSAGRVCEPVFTDQSVLNAFFGTWRRIEVQHAVHYREYNASRPLAPWAAVVHFVGPDKPFAWFKVCARRRVNATTRWLGPPTTPPRMRKSKTNPALHTKGGLKIVVFDSKKK